MVGLLDFRSHSKSGPFATQSFLDHSKSRLGQILDPHCKLIRWLVIFFLLLLAKCSSLTCLYCSFLSLALRLDRSLVELLVQSGISKRERREKRRRFWRDFSNFFLFKTAKSIFVNSVGGRRDFLCEGRIEEIVSTRIKYLK